MSHDQYHEYVKQAGPKAKMETIRQIPDMQQMSREEKQENVSEIFRTEKQGVRDSMRQSMPISSLVNEKKKKGR